MKSAVRICVTAFGGATLLQALRLHDDDAAFMQDVGPNPLDILASRLKKFKDCATPEIKSINAGDAIAAKIEGTVERCLKRQGVTAEEVKDKIVGCMADSTKCQNLSSAIKDEIKDLVPADVKKAWKAMAQKVKVAVAKLKTNWDTFKRCATTKLLTKLRGVTSEHAMKAAVRAAVKECAEAQGISQDVVDAAVEDIAEEIEGCAADLNQCAAKIKAVIPAEWQNAVARVAAQKVEEMKTIVNLLKNKFNKFTQCATQNVIVEAFVSGHITNPQMHTAVVKCLEEQGIPAEEGKDAAEKILECAADTANCSTELAAIKNMIKVLGDKLNAIKAASSKDNIKVGSAKVLKVVQRAVAYFDKLQIAFDKSYPDAGKNLGRVGRGVLAVLRKARKVAADKIAAEMNNGELRRTLATFSGDVAETTKQAVKKSRWSSMW